MTDHPLIGTPSRPLATNLPASQELPMVDFDLNTPEVWYPIPDSDGFELSTHFRVRDSRGRLRRPSPIGAGYPVFNLRRQGKHRTVYLHHLVALFAHGPRPPGLWVLHRDDDPSNNRPSNLYYGTPAQNMADQRKNGRIKLGSDRRSSKITGPDVEGIRRSLADGRPQSRIARDFGVSQSLVSRIKSGHRWGWMES